jgi:transposase
MMETVTRKRYTREFKVQAIGLVEAGKPVRDVARDLTISEGVLYEWVRKNSKTAQVGSGGQSAPQLPGAEPAADELRRLRRENAHLKLENDILKKAAVILGTKPQPTDER